MCIAVKFADVSFTWGFLVLHGGVSRPSLCRFGFRTSTAKWRCKSNQFNVYDSYEFILQICLLREALGSFCQGQTWKDSVPCLNLISSGSPFRRRRADTEANVCRPLRKLHQATPRCLQSCRWQEPVPNSQNLGGFGAVNPAGSVYPSETNQVSQRWTRLQMRSGTISVLGGPNAWTN